MRIILFIVTLLVVSPAFGQSRVFTNADLGKPLSRSTTLRPAAAAAVLAPYQFVDAAPPEWLLGPTVTVLNSSPTAGPFGEFREFSPGRRLDGSSFADSPWSTTAYGRQQGRSLRGSGKSKGGFILPSYRPMGSLTTRATLYPESGLRPASGTGFGPSRRDRRHPRRD